jgi:ribonuclease Z
MNNLIKIISVILLLSTLSNCTSDNRDQLIYSAIKKQVDDLTKTDQYTKNDEAITVVTVGTASPLPGERAQTGTAVIVNGHFFLFDVGAGVVQKIENFNLPWQKLDGIFITHYHSDHVMDLPNAISRSWQRGRVVDLHIYGPQGLNDLMASVDDFLAVDKEYRLAHHGIEIMDTVYADGIPNEFVIEQDSYKLIYDTDGVRITAFDVTHEPIEPAVGYKIEYMGKKVVISGDTKKNELLTEMAQDCDLLIHEVMLMEFQQMLARANEEAGLERNAAIVTDIQDYHTSPAEVAEIAKKANVKQVVLNHLAPVPTNRILEKMYLDRMTAFEGEIHLANDGDVFIVQ